MWLILYRNNCSFDEILFHLNLLLNSVNFYDLSHHMYASKQVEEFLFVVLYGCYC